MFSVINNKIRQYGFTRSIIRLFKFILRKLGATYEQYLFCVLRLENGKLSTGKKPLIDMEIKELSLEDFLHSEGITFSKRRFDLIKNRFKKESYKALGCFSNGKLIYVAWISLREFRMSYPCCDDTYILKRDEGLLIDAYCHPAYRGLGLHTFMNTIRLRKLYELGKKKAIAIILCENIPARKSQAHVGFRCTKMIIYVRIFGFDFCRMIEKKMSLA